MVENAFVYIYSYKSKNNLIFILCIREHLHYSQIIIFVDAAVVKMTAVLVLLMYTLGICFAFPVHELEALESLYNSTNGKFWTWRNNSVVGNMTVVNVTGGGAIWNFTSDANPCLEHWQGVVCYSNCTVDASANCLVRSLELVEFNLSGSIPPQISQLTGLNRFNVFGNYLTGTIPESIGYFSALSELWLGSNSLTGSIPSTVYSLTTLVGLELEFNRLTGTLSSAIGSLTRLSVLGVGLNLFTGTLPTELVLLADSMKCKCV